MKPEVSAADHHAYLTQQSDVTLRSRGLASIPTKQSYSSLLQEASDPTAQRRLSPRLRKASLLRALQNNQIRLEKTIKQPPHLVLASSGAEAEKMKEDKYKAYRSTSKVYYF